MGGEGGAIGVETGGGGVRPDPRFARPRTLVFGIGAQKAATSWLDRYLRGHPQVCLPVRKELHYWTAMRLPGAERVPGRVREGLARFEAEGPLGRLLRSPHKRAKARSFALAARMVEDTSGTHAGYADALFQRYRGEPVAGEITPAYALLDAATFAEMAGLAPDVRFLFVMRDPLDRLNSGLRHRLRKRHGREGVTPERLAERLERTLAESGDGARARSRYDQTIARLEAAVPRERIAYFFFETLFRQSEMDRLTAFLGIAPRPAPLERRVHVGAGSGLALPPSLAARAEAALAPAYAAVRARFGDFVPETWRRPAAPVAALRASA